MRKLKRLSAQFVATAANPGLYPDGGGLWLQVTASRGGNDPARSWIFRYKRQGRTRNMGLGPVYTVSLAEARRRAAACRLLLLDDVDPLEARRAERSRVRVEAAKARTFRQDAEAYIAAHADGWRNSKHRAQWASTLETYAFPVLGDLPVDAIDTALVLRVLEPIWRRRPRRRAGCAAGSRRSSTGRPRAATAQATTRRAGAATSTSCCRGAPRWRR